ncbi:PDF receptor-like [Artemia franciscana]|uniref:Uncharacterized protein n=1 Tax=Artemia franciscana TaxID=6661 RepID=A0AA88HFB2_ARTSF|nr:hypothetical protein QYM36_013811 [Artemia franciscana]
MDEIASLSPAQKCLESISEGAIIPGWCQPVWDDFLCWPQTENGSMVELPCPDGRMSRIKNKAFRICDYSGRWEGDPEWEDVNLTGYSNYSACFAPHMWNMLMDLGEEYESDIRIKIARITRKIEFIGYSISTVCLLVSLFIFFKFRSLRNARTRLHINLLATLLINGVLRLILYSDLAFTFFETYEETMKGIHSIKMLCEFMYILLEFSKMAVFFCMLMEGLYLQNLISVHVFRVAKLAKVYILLGWILPVPLILMWMMCMIYEGEGVTCWWGYHDHPCFWFLQGPMLCILLVNFILLIFVVRVLLTKLKTSKTPELHQVRKATKAAFILLPLLGIPYIVIMIGPPSLNRNWVEFGLWALISHLFVSFQGFIIALLFCLTNKEVTFVVGKKIRDFVNSEKRNRRGTDSTVLFKVYRRQSPFSANDQTTQDQAPMVKDSLIVSTNL